MPPAGRLAALQLPFVANTGQAPADVAFTATSVAGTVAVTHDGALRYRLAKPSARRPGAARTTLTERVVGSTVRGVRGDAPAPTTISVLHGADARRWQRNVPTYARVDVGDVAPGVRLVLHAAREGVEKRFHVTAGADVAPMRLEVDGAERLRLTDDGALAADTALGEVRFTAPVAFQEGAAGREPVRVAYVVDGTRYGFAVGSYDHARELVIDPILEATYLGGADYFDEIHAMTIGADGNVYVAGNADSMAFPGVDGDSADAFKGDGFDDAFVAKLHPGLHVVLAATFLGGSGLDGADALAIDGGGTVYVAGFTQSTDFPGVDAGSADAAPTCDPDADGDCTEGFVARLDADLTTILAATYLGGSRDDAMRGLTLAGGAVYAVGGTDSADFPSVHAGSADATMACDVTIAYCEGVVAKLNAGLSAVVAASYVGGESSDALREIVSAPAGDLYVVGWTESAQVPGVGPGSADSSPSLIAGAGQGLAVRLDPALSVVTAATLLGGSGTAGLTGVALDAAGAVYVTGFERSDDLPGIDDGSYDPTLDGDFDAIVAKLDAGLSTVLAATYLGGAGSEWSAALVLDAAGRVHVTGYTGSSSFPGIDDLAADPEGWGNEGFVATFDAGLGSLLGATYLGGSQHDELTALALDAAGDVYVAGSTRCDDVPGIDAASADASNAGIEYDDHATDGLIAKLAGCEFTTLGNNDGDGLRDGCDADDDNDGCLDGADENPLDASDPIGTWLAPGCVPSSGTQFGFAGDDTDHDGIRNCNDPDDDDDDLADAVDPCRTSKNNTTLGCQQHKKTCFVAVDVCAGRPCNDLFIKLVSVVNPDPTLALRFDLVGGVGPYLYVKPVRGQTLETAAKAWQGVAAIASGARSGGGTRIEVWRKATQRAPEELVRVLGEYDPSRVVARMRRRGALLRVTMPGSRDPRLRLDAVWAVGATPNGRYADTDRDRVPDASDNCPALRNADQVDADRDGLGDACEASPAPHAGGALG